MTQVQWCCSKAWHQILGQRPRFAHCKGAFPGALICFWSSDWSLAHFGLGSLTSVQTVSRHCSATGTARDHSQLAAWIQLLCFGKWESLMNGCRHFCASWPRGHRMVQAEFNFLKETQPQVSLSLPLTSWVVRIWLFTYENDFVKMEHAWKNGFKDYLLWIWFFLTWQVIHKLILASLDRVSVQRHSLIIYSKKHSAYGLFSLLPFCSGDQPAERSAFVFPVLDLMIEAFQTELQHTASIHNEFLDK